MLKILVDSLTERTERTTAGNLLAEDPGTEIGAHSIALV